MNISTAEKTNRIQRNINSLIRDALKRYNLWSFLSWQEIVMRYRRSTLGPFWISISMSLFIITIGFLFSNLFKVDIESYLPHLAVSYVVWWLISSSLNEAPTIYIQSAQLIQEIKINPLIFVFKSILKNLLIFFHHLIIIVMIYLYFDINPGINFILGILGLILVLLNLYFASIIIAIVGARYRDIAPMVQSIVQISFFITPITWMPKLLDSDSIFLVLNPFAHFLEITRAPFLGMESDPTSWVISILILLILYLISSWLHVAKQHRIIYWI